MPYSDFSLAQAIAQFSLVLHAHSPQNPMLMLQSLSSSYPLDDN